MLHVDAFVISPSDKKTACVDLIGFAFWWTATCLVVLPYRPGSATDALGLLARFWSVVGIQQTTILGLDDIGLKLRLRIDAHLGRTACAASLHEILLLIWFAAYGRVGLWAFGVDGSGYQMFVRTSTGIANVLGGRGASTFTQ